MRSEHEAFLKSMYYRTETPVVNDEVIDFIDNFSLRGDLKYEAALISRDGGITDKEVRDTLTYRASENVGMDEEHVKFDNTMFQIVSTCIAQYDKAFPLFNYTIDSGYDILKYKKGGHYTFHHDSSPTSPRVLTFLYFVNDDYEGGEFQMWEDGEAIKMPKGSIAIFPSSHYFLHRVLPVTSGERRSVVTWLELKLNDDENNDAERW